MAYSKQTWVRGEKVASVKLNHMEDGISAISANGAIDTANLANASVTNDKLDQEAVDSNNIRTGAIITPLIYDGAVTMPKLGADVIAELDNKADIDGSYESMTVGNAEQLVSTVGVSDNAPYTFRTTGGSADVGDRMNLKAVVGGTVAWNQLSKELNSTNWTAESGVTASYTDGVATISSTTANNGIKCNTGVAPVAGHKYYLAFAAKSDSPVTFKFGYASASGVQGIANTTSSFARYENIKNCTTATLYGQIFLLSTTTYSNVQVKDAILIDLTAMFGSTIADYVYTLESGTAGAGIAWLKKYGYFTKPYYPYAAANLQSVKTSAHRTIGFNQWDEEWELGYYNVDTGESTSSNSNIRCKNKIKVVPNTTYYIKAPNTLWILEYDANDIYLNKYISKTNQVFTTSANTQYIRFYAVNSYGTTYNHDICINLHWDGERDGEYEPYEAHEYALDDITLRGILKLDANNNLYADGDRYLPDGTVERRYGVVDLGTLTWASNVTSEFYALGLPIQKTGYTNATKAPMICGKYQTVVFYSGGVYFEGKDKVTTFAFGSGSRLYIKDTSYTDVAAFKAMLTANNVQLVYEFATPTTETADPYQQLEIVDDFGTEEFVDAAVEAGERDVAIPVGNVTFYPQNLRKKIEGLPFDFSTLIARTEKAFKATKAYAVNEFLIINNQLYKTRTSIANGANITVGTNVTATTIGAELTAILNS